MKDKKPDQVIPDGAKDRPGRVHSTQQIKITDENATKYTAAFLIKVYGRLGYIIKLMEEGKKDSNPRVL